MPCHEQSIAAISVVLATQADISKAMPPVQPNGPGIVSFDFKDNLHAICITPAVCMTDLEPITIQFCSVEDPIA